MHNWPFTKTHPLQLLSLCPKSHAALTHTCSPVEQRGNWQHANRQDRAGYFWCETRSQFWNVVFFSRNSNNKYRFVALECLYLLNAQNKHEWTSECILFQLRMKDINIQHCSSLSPPKLIYSPVRFVCWASWLIWRYNWSDRLSIKLFGNCQVDSQFSCQLKQTRLLNI